MTKPVRTLPSLDLLRGFEAAARHLSFTEAAEELFVTQSAVSRQIKTLEQQLGLPLFLRRNRALFLTEAGQTLYRSSASILAQLRDTLESLRAGSEPRILGISTTVSFAALWLIPRLGSFRATHPGIDVRVSATTEVQDLKREHLDLAIRYVRPNVAPSGASKLFGEEVFVVCSKTLCNDPKRPLKSPEDLRRHVLLHYEDSSGRWPWFSWASWLEAMGIPDLRPQGVLQFNQYDQMIQAAIDGQGVALGRSSLVERLIRQGRLTAPFGEDGNASGAYFILTAPGADRREDVQQFLHWLGSEVAAMLEARKDWGIE